MLETESNRSENSALISILDPSEIGRSQLSVLLDQAFGLAPGHHYLDDFPVWNTSLSMEGASVEVLGAYVKGQLAASAALRVAEARTLLGQTVSVGIIGAVATEAHFRGQGLASRLVTQLTQNALKQGAQLAVLWSSEREFYQRLGFEPFGKQARVVLEDLTLDLGQGGPREAVYEGWSPALFSLIQKRSTGIVLKNSDRPWYEAHRNVQWFFTGTPENPTAYVAVGRGIDLKGHIHEWGGAKQSLIQILAFLKKTAPNLVLLGHPELLKGLLGQELVGEHREELCLAKNLSESAISDQLRDSVWIWGLDAA